MLALVVRNAVRVARLSFAAALGVAAVASAAAAEEPLRDPWLRPFSASSIWNTPIGADAKFVAADLGPAKTIGIDAELLIRVPEGAPVRTLLAPAGWETRAGGTQPVGQLPIPDELVVPDARKHYTPNNCAAFLLPDRKTVRHVGVLCRPEAGGAVYGYPFNPDSDLHGEGLHGSHGASALSALGGSVRLGELTSDEPIRHALKVDVWCKKYAYYGPDRKGFRWPATRADSYAEKEYGGKNPAVVMGTLLAIPATVDEASLKLKTAVGRKLFAALRDYGAYVVDDSAWDCHYLCAEEGVDAEVERTFGFKFDGSSRELLDDVNALFTALRVVDDNAPGNVGGAGKRLAPPAGPLAPLAAPAAK